jgi:hypothetical protein
MIFFIETLKHTPIWVYVLLAFLIAAGIRSMRTIVLPVFGLLIPSAALLIISLSSVYSIVHGRNILFVVWGCAFLCGLFAGNKFVVGMGIMYDRTSRRVTIPGSYLYMVLYLVIFGIRYYFGFKQATDPGYVDGINVSAAMASLSGLSTGMLGGFLLYCFRKRRETKIDLVD